MHKLYICMCLANLGYKPPNTGKKKTHVKNCLSQVNLCRTYGDIFLLDNRWKRAYLYCGQYHP